MIERLKTCIVCLVILLAGCRAGWVGLDGGAAAANELQAARVTCRVDAKLAALKQAEIAKNRRVSSAANNEAKMLLKDDHALEVRAVDSEIDACMLRLGFKRPG